MRFPPLRVSAKALEPMGNAVNHKIGGVRDASCHRQRQRIRLSRE